MNGEPAPAAVCGAAIVLAGMLTLGLSIPDGQTISIATDVPCASWLGGNWYDEQGKLELVVAGCGAESTLRVRKGSWLGSFCLGETPSGASAVGGQLQLQCSDAGGPTALVLRERRWLNIHNRWLRRNPDPFWILQKALERLRKSLEDFAVESL